jgi:hypothetical protein
MCARQFMDRFAIYATVRAFAGGGAKPRKEAVEGNKATDGGKGDNVRENNPDQKGKLVTWEEYAGPPQTGGAGDSSTLIGYARAD